MGLRCLFSWKVFDQFWLLYVGSLTLIFVKYFIKYISWYHLGGSHHEKKRCACSRRTVFFRLRICNELCLDSEMLSALDLKMILFSTHQELAWMLILALIFFLPIFRLYSWNFSNLVFPIELNKYILFFWKILECLRRKLSSDLELIRWQNFNIN